MIDIIIIDRADISHQISIPEDIGLNLMEVCKAEGLPVEGTCGGIALCASCHLYIVSDHDLPPRSHEEEDMLDQAFFVRDNSRLGCQVKLTPELNSLIVKLAPV